MKVSTAINTLRRIQRKFGDISITGGAMSNDRGPARIVVTDSEGMEIWPREPNGVAGKNTIDGVFIE